jgi:Ni,Fe-hydrogenase III large subunit
MNIIKTKNNRPIKRTDIPVIPLEEMASETAALCNSGMRLISFFGAPEKDGVRVYAIIADDEASEIFVTSALSKRGAKYTSVSGKCPQFQLFERELFEQYDIEPSGHPWLKPVRYPTGAGKMADYPFFKMEGKEAHEVGVGPVHAGIIEPGHFRFSCVGEKVSHLEIQLGYQHRGVEKMMEKKDSVQLAESIAGDTAVGHALAYCQAKEALCGCVVSREAEAARGIMLELERAAMHLFGLSALAGDVAYLPGNAVFGAIRTLVINSSLAICGSRFGRGMVKQGGCEFGIDAGQKERVIVTLDETERNIDTMAEAMFDAASVLSRMQHTGIVDLKTAKEIGLTGPAARGSGVQVDSRADHPHGVYLRSPVYKRTMESGDVFARGYIRYMEIKQSYKLIREELDFCNTAPAKAECGPCAAGSFIVSLVEGWRGEIAHCVMTDANGKIERCKIKDPSFNNWLALALCVRENGISDFPLCNKSFDLSYCGNDL